MRDVVPKRGDEVRKGANRSVKQGETRCELKDLGPGQRGLHSSSTLRPTKGFALRSSSVVPQIALASHQGSLRGQRGLHSSPTLRPTEGFAFRSSSVVPQVVPQVALRGHTEGALTVARGWTVNLPSQWSAWATLLINQRVTCTMIPRHVAADVSCLCVICVDVSH